MPGIDAEWKPPLTITDMHQAGVFASRPAADAVVTGTFYLATDTTDMYRSNGTSWDITASSGGASTYAALTDTTIAGIADDDFAIFRSASGDWENQTVAEALVILGVESGATADQSGAEIKSAYEAEANAFTDTQFTKLAGIDTGAADDQTAAEIRTLVEAATDSNVFTDADHTNLNAQSGTNTGDQTTEQLQDIAGPLVATGGTKTGIAVTYQDATGDMDFVVDPLNDLPAPDGPVAFADGTQALPAITFTNDPDAGLWGGAGVLNVSVGAAWIMRLWGNAIDFFFPLNMSDKSILQVGAIESNVNVVAAAGATETLDTSLYRVHDITLDVNCTFTFSNPAASGEHSEFELWLTQDGSGTNVVTWPASVVWDSGNAPNLSTAANDLTLLGFATVDGGTTWVGSLIALSVS